MKTKSPISKLKPFYPSPDEKITLIFDRLEQQILRHPLIVIDMGVNYYYLSFWSMTTELGERDKHLGEIVISPTKNKKIIKKESYLDLSHLYCMEKSAMEKFVDVKEAKLENLNFEDQKIVIEQLIKNLSYIPPFCSVLQVNYDPKQQAFLPDLIFCHPEIWKATKKKWEYKKPRELIRIEKKLSFHRKNNMECCNGSVAYRVERDLDYIVYNLENELEKMNDNQNKNIEDENDHFLSHEPQAEWEEYHLKQEDSSREIRVMLKAAKTKVSLKPERDCTPLQEWNFKEPKNDREQNELEPKKTREQDDDDEGRQNEK